MNYIERSIGELVAIATAELAHADGMPARSQAWAAYEQELKNAEDSLGQAKAPAVDGWQDDAGKQFDARTRASQQSIWDKRTAVQAAELHVAFADLETAIRNTHKEVMDAYAEYLAAVAAASAARGGADGLAGAEQAAQQRAGAALNALGALYNETAQKVQQASGPGIVWNGPAGSGGGSGAGGGPATTAGGAPGGAAGGAPAGGAPAGGAPAGGAPAGGAPAGGAPAGGAAGGAAGGPSLAGATPTPVMPTVPPAGAMPSVTPASMPTLPPVAPIAPIGGVPAASTGGVFGGGRGVVPGVTGLSSAPTSIPKASNVTGSVPVPAAGQAPQVPAAGGARPTGGATPGFGGVPPMMPPMAGAAAGAGGRPKPGSAEKPAKRTARPPRTVPGVPAELRGRAGKLDAKQANLFPVARPTARDDEKSTVELIDEDLWQVGEQERNPLAGRG